MCITDLLENNKKWAKGVVDSDPDFFNRLSQQQSPPYLWIGCSDSRVPANQITGLLPGEVFVHRNIANQVIPGDENLAAVLEFALKALRVKQIIVCGHYGCGGVEAALGVRSANGLPHVTTWLESLTDVVAEHKKELDDLPSDTERVKRMCELNVSAQISNLEKLPLIHAARRAGIEFEIHGFIYGIHDGLLRELSKI